MDNYFEDETDNEYDSSDNEYNGLNDETDNETELDNTEYEPEEISLTRYNIVLCEIYNATIHGQSNEAKGHYLTHTRLKNLDLNFINRRL